MAQRTLGDDLIPVPPAISLAQEVALLDELGHDPMRSPLGDAHRRRDVAQADARIIGHAGEDVGVLGEKSQPAVGGCESCLTILEGAFMNP